MQCTCLPHPLPSCPCLLLAHTGVLLAHPFTDPFQRDWTVSPSLWLRELGTSAGIDGSQKFSEVELSLGCPPGTVGPSCLYSLDFGP